MQRGFSLVDIIVAIGVIAAIALTAGALVATGPLRTGTRHRLIASLLAENMLAAARSLPESELQNRTNGIPIGILMPWGSFSLQAVSGAPSLPNSVATVATGTPASGITSALPLPDILQDGKRITASFQASPDAGAGWRMGFLFRARDLENGYRYTIGATNLQVEKAMRGTRTTLWSGGSGIATGAWVSLGIETNGTSLMVYRNGSLIHTLSDATFGSGAVAAIGVGAVLPLADSIAVTDATSWTFDRAPTGTLPYPWNRLGPGALPNGSADLTIANTYTSGTLKTITARIKWTEGSDLQTLTAASYR